METQIKDLPKSQKEVNVVISTQEMENYTKEALTKLSKKIKVDGFRDGKVPADVAEKQIGNEAIFEEATHNAVEKSYFKIIKENKLEPIGQPQVDFTKSAMGNPLEFKIVINVMPKVKLGDYEKVEGKIEKVNIDDKRIELELETIQKKRATYITEDKKASDGDRIEIDFETRVGGVKIEGGESKNHPLILGQGQFIPGFEKELVGLKKDDIKEFSLKFPEEYSKKELAGKSAQFKAEVKLVQKVDLPEINDAFAKSLGKFENLEKRTNCGRGK